MKITQKAIVKAVSSRGFDILSSKNLLCMLLDDLAPEQIDDIQFIRRIYTDEIGHILTEAVQAPYADKEKYYKEIDVYLQEHHGLVEAIRIKFINVFRDAFKRKTVEVKKYKDYKPALRMLKQEFGPDLSDDIVQAFLEENRLFYRFSITEDDVKHDIKTV